MLEEKQLDTVKNIFKQYDGKLPLSRFLKNIYNSEKKFGSKDRRRVSDTMFFYFRVASGFPDLGFEEKAAIGYFLCQANLSDFGKFLIEKETNLSSVKDPSRRLEQIKMNYPDFEIRNLFPFEHHLCFQPDESFYLSFLKPPKLWVRVKKGYEKVVQKALHDESITFEVDKEIANCYSLENGIKINELKIYDQGLLEIQDGMSQQTLDKVDLSNIETLWDCCAGAGGKSLLLLDKKSNLNLVVSDIRESILISLKERFKRAGYKKVRAFPADLTKKDDLPTEEFDMIIADVPCSGSGTWARTPERLSFFSTDELKFYSDRQFRIVSNILDCLKVNGVLYYITCSVFKEENESIVEKLLSENDLELLDLQILKGYKVEADSMFFAKLRKRS